MGPDKRHPGAFQFREPVQSRASWPIEVIGWWTPVSRKLSYTVLYRRNTRIIGLDLGPRLSHQVPKGDRLRGTHKHLWNPDLGSKYAYSPADITANWDEPALVWIQFCTEIHLRHQGILEEPREFADQEELLW